MEFIAAILVIVVLCIMLGVSTGVMIAAALALVGLIIVFVAAFFTVSLVRLLLSEKAEAKFSRIDKRPNGKFRVAYYNGKRTGVPQYFPRGGSVPQQALQNRQDLYRADRPKPQIRIRQVRLRHYCGRLCFEDNSDRARGLGVSGDVGGIIWQNIIAIAVRMNLKMI